MKKEQIIVIHGGTTYSTKKEYISALKGKKLDIERLRSRPDWKAVLGERLGSSYDVLTPRMPNSSNAQYSEWKLWFEKVLEVARDEIMLIGHSLGGLFLIKYLSENTPHKIIKSLSLVAPPHSRINPSEKSFGSFTVKKGIENILRQVPAIYFYFSDNDKVVPLAHARAYQEEFKSATHAVIEYREHFTDSEFPELIRDLKAPTQ